MFIAKIKRTVKKHCMLEPGEKVVVGVSGGPDSMALLSVLHQMQEKYNFQLVVAHLNHGFRGKEAARDAQFVQERAQGFGLACEVKTVDVPSFKKRSTLSSQEAARLVRYQFLEDVRMRFHASKIALGHTADDQAETLMMWLLRGTGLKGLGGMPPVRGGIIIRPLIETTREEIETYLEEKSIPFVLDSSNQNADYVRNKLREQLFPVLKEHYNPQLVKRLAQTAEIVRIDNEYLDNKAQVMLEDIIISRDSRSAVIDRAGLVALPVALQLRCLRSVLEQVKGNLRRISSTHLKTILRIVANDKPYKVLQLPDGIRVEKSYQQLKLTLELSALLPFHYCFTVIPDRVRIEEIGRELNFAIREGNGYAGIAHNTRVACLDAEKVVMPLTIRNVKPGDRFQPLGMQGEKKIKDFFIDEKVPLRERKRIPLVLCNEVVAWVGGMRIDHRLRVTKNTRKVLTIALKSEDRGQE